MRRLGPLEHSIIAQHFKQANAEVGGRIIPAAAGFFEAIAPLLRLAEAGEVDKMNGLAGIGET